MLTYNPFYEDTLIGLAVVSVFLNIYGIFLIFFKLPKSMHDFRHCICLLCVLDGLFAFLLGVVINVTFQFPALAGVVKGPVIMFCYRIFGYNGCRVIACLTFTLIAAIIYCQNYGIKFRFFTIHPNKKYFEFYSSTRGLIYVYSSCVVSASIVGIAIYLMMYSENEIPILVAEYPSTKDVFMDYIPGENLLMAADPHSPVWYFIFGYVTVAVLVVNVSSYAMFFMAMRMLKTYSNNFTKQTLQMQKQFLTLLIVQATTPLAFLVIPVLLLVYQVTFDMPQARLQTEIGMIWVGLYSNVNAALTIFCISPFRKFTKRITVDLVLRLFGVNVKQLNSTMRFSFPKLEAFIRKCTGTGEKQQKSFRPLSDDKDVKDPATAFEPSTSEDTGPRLYATFLTD